MKPKTKRFLLGFGRVVLALVIIFVVVLVVQDRLARKKLKTVEQRLVEDGLPLTWDDVEKMYADIDPDRTGQKALAEALKKIENVPEIDNEILQKDPITGTAAYPDMQDPLPEEMLSAMTSVLDAYAPSIADLNEAVSMKPLYFQQPTNVYSLPFIGSLGAIRQSTRIYTTRAIVMAEQGRIDEAIEAISDAVELSKVLENNPYVIIALVRHAITGLAYTGLERVLSSESLTVAHLEKLEDVLAYKPASTGEAVAGEIVYFRHVYASMKNTIEEKFNIIKYDEGSRIGRLMFLSPSTGWLKMNQAYRTQQMHDIYNIWDKPWSEFLEEHNRIMQSIPWFYDMRVWDGLFRGVKIGELRAVGKWDCARIALAIRKYMMEHDKLPETLQKLSPAYMSAVPKEPFLNEDYFYKVDGNVVTISFVAPNIKNPMSFSFRIAPPNPEMTTKTKGKDNE